MRMLGLELKRLLKTRSVSVLLCAALLLSGVMAYFPISFVGSYVMDGQGNVTQVSGLVAIQAEKEWKAASAGTVTEEKVQNAIRTFRECYQEYGSIFPPEVPMEVYLEKIEPVYDILNACDWLAPPQVYLLTMTDQDIQEEDAEDFYEKWQTAFTQQEAKEEVQRQIREMAAQVETPFTYVPGYSSESFDYLVLYLFLLLFLYAVIAAQSFSAEYQTGADHILRCAKYGRWKLAIVKMGAVLILFAGTFAAGAAVFLLITNSAFGWEGLSTSIQMMGSVFKLPDLTIGQTQAVTVLCGFLTLAASISCVLFVSAKSRNVHTAMIISIFLCLLPTIIYMVSSANVADILRSILPSGGIGLSNSFLFELEGTNFAQIGSVHIWLPYLMMGAAVVEIPVFLLLAGRAYSRTSNRTLYNRT